MGVDLGGFNICMAQQLLQGPDVSSGWFPWGKALYGTKRWVAKE